MLIYATRHVISIPALCIALQPSSAVSGAPARCRRYHLQHPPAQPPTLTAAPRWPQPRHRTPLQLLPRPQPQPAAPLGHWEPTCGARWAPVRLH